MTKDEALKMAIEAFELYADVNSPIRNKAIQACKDALEPTIAELNDEYLRDTHVEGMSKAKTQEPYGYIWLDKNLVERYSTIWPPITGEKSMSRVVPIYTTPPSREWQSLTHEEFVAIAKSIWGDNLGMSDGFGYTVAWASSYATIELSSKMLLLLQVIDKALREKNG